jgi:hypothetical protein
VSFAEFGRLIGTLGTEGSVGSSVVALAAMRGEAEACTGVVDRGLDGVEVGCVGITGSEGRSVDVPNSADCNGGTSGIVGSSGNSPESLETRADGGRDRLARAWSRLSGRRGLTVRAFSASVLGLDVLLLALLLPLHAPPVLFVLLVVLREGGRSLSGDLVGVLIASLSPLGSLLSGTSGGA